MSTAGGPKIVSDGLVFALDAASSKMSKAGCAGFNSAEQLIKNLVSTGDTVTSTSDLRLGNLTFYTIYSITYPEGDYNPAGASGTRDGITPGFNDVTSSELLDFSRDLNYAVWNNKTNGWVADSYFNGERIAGHCYDTYDTGGNAATEHVQFQNDYEAIVDAFPDATHIVCGSHAAENNDSDANTKVILQDLGGPSSWPTDRAEYVLIGKPGLGAGNAYVWQYQNDSTERAHANVGLPILGGKKRGGNYLDFNGSSDKVDLGIRTVSGLTNYSISFWVNLDVWTSSGSTQYQIYAEESGIWIANYIDKIGIDFHNGSSWMDSNGGHNDGMLITVPSSDQTNTWLHVTVTYSGSTSSTSATITGYLNGSQNFQVTTSYGSGSSSQLYSSSTTSYRGGIGYRRHYTTNYFNGKMANMNMYNKTLSATQVKQNFNSQRRRFGV